MLTPEINVIIETSLYLSKYGWVIKAISIPRGQGLNYYLQKRELISRFTGDGINPDNIELRPNGPDIVAVQEEKVWKIECKGLGAGKAQTLRNNFDRAVSSAVSYFDGEATYVGLALPLDRSYLDFIRSRIPHALRSAIHLWIFLYDPIRSSIKVIAPRNHAVTIA